MADFVTKDSFKEQVLQSELPVMVDFFATWCGPCQMIAPIIEEIAAEHPEYKVVKVDVDNDPELAQMFSIVSIPTIVAIKNGEVTNKIVGYVSKNKLLEMMK